MSQRTERVDELLREEIGAILARDVQDRRIGFATITDVETTPDLRHARVWVSVIGSAADRAEALAALERAMGFVRHELGRRLRIKRIPELHVRLDESSERGTRLLRLLSELEEGQLPAEPQAGETLPTPVARIPRPGEAEEPPQPSPEETDASADAAGRGAGTRAGRPRPHPDARERRQRPGSGGRGARSRGGRGDARPGRSSAGGRGTRP